MAINDDAESIPGTKGSLKEFSVVSADNLAPDGYIVHEVKNVTN